MTNIGCARWGSLLLGLWSSTALTLPALAQTANAPVPAAGGAVPEQPAEIVVTAQKRAQNLQSVPISIQALTATKLDQLQVRNFKDYVEFLPSVNYTTGSNGLPGSTNTIFRGIATDGGLIPSATLPTVGTYLDEQPVTSISGTLDIQIYDVARVEALAGPQGTLYGASAEAGVVRIITNKPDVNKFSGSYTGELNQILSHGNGGSFQAYANIPIIPGSVALRAVSWYEHTGGYIDNALHVRTFATSGITQNNSALLGKDLNEVDKYGGRLALGIELGEHWTVTPTVMAQQTDFKGSFRSDDTKIGELKVGHFFPEFGRDSFYQAGLTITGKVSDFDIVYSGNYLDRARDDQHDYSDYGFYYDAISGSGSLNKDNAGHLIDPSQLNHDYNNTTKLSHELRVSSPVNKPIRGVVGLFYQRQTQREESDYINFGLADARSIPGRPGTLWLTLEQRIDRDYAVFGQVDWDVTKKLTLTGGGRGYKFDNSLVGFFGVNTSLFGTGTRRCLPVDPKTGVSVATGGPYGIGAAVVSGTPCTNVGIVNADGSISPKRSTGDGATWRANATYKFNHDHLAYFTASTGFRPGGINRAGNAGVFDADHLTNYEIGTKNSFFDRRVTFNLTGFWEEWDGVQVTFQVPGGSGVAQIANAGGARSRGVEGDLSWRMASGFTLTGAATYADAVLTSDLFTGKKDPAGNPVPSAPSGTRLPLTPQFKGNLIGRYDFDAGSYRLHAQLAGTYTGRRSSVLVVSDNNKLGSLPDYFQLGASIGGEKGNFSAEFYVRNLTDARGQQSRAAECNINYCGPSSFDPVGEIYRVYIQPRTIGIRFGQKF